MFGIAEAVIRIEPEEDLLFAARDRDRPVVARIHREGAIVAEQIIRLIGYLRRFRDRPRARGRMPHAVVLSAAEGFEGARQIDGATRRLHGDRRGRARALGHGHFRPDGEIFAAELDGLTGDRDDASDHETLRLIRIRTAYEIAGAGRYAQQQDAIARREVRNERQRERRIIAGDGPPFEDRHVEDAHEDADHERRPKHDAEGLAHSSRA